MAQKEHFSLRLSSETKRALERQAAERRQSKTRLAEQYLDEAVRLAAHPGIVFRDGPAGRRPGLAGGPDVWEVMMVFREEGHDPAATAAALALPVGLVDIALGYYADHRQEIDSWIALNQQAADEAEAAWSRRRAIGLT